MSPYRLGTVLLTVLGVALVCGGVIAVAALLIMVGFEFSGQMFLRVLGAFALPAATGMVLLSRSETIARKFLPDEGGAPSVCSPRDLVRVGLVVLGILFIALGAISLISWLLTHGFASGWFSAMLGILVEIGVGLVLVTQSVAITDMVWRSEPPRAP